MDVWMRGEASSLYIYTYALTHSVGVYFQAALYLLVKGWAEVGQASS